MTAIYFLIGCSLLIAICFLGAFFWANNSGQHDDTYTPSVRILFEDEAESVQDENGQQSAPSVHPNNEQSASRRTSSTSNN